MLELKTECSIYEKDYSALEGTAMEGYPIDYYMPDLSLGIQYVLLNSGNEEALKRNGVAWPKTFHQDICLAGNTNGIRIIHVFETDNKAIVSSRLGSILGTSSRIFARKCKIVEIDNTISKNFLVLNHIQGNVNSKIKYGLEYDGEIVAVMTFSRAKRVASEFQGTVMWELVRYVNKLGCTVVGGASRLFKHFIRNNEFDHIVSYADRRYSGYDNTVYDQLEFFHSHDSQANYFYFFPEVGVLESRMKYQKAKLPYVSGFNFNPSKTEYQNCLDNGLQKIWDCGNAVYYYSNF